MHAMYAQFSTRTGELLTQGFTLLLILLCSFSLSRTSVRSHTVGHGLSVLFLFEIIITRTVRVSGRESEVFFPEGVCGVYITISKPPRWSMNLEFSSLM